MAIKTLSKSESSTWRAYMLRWIGGISLSVKKKNVNIENFVGIEKRKGRWITKIYRH